MQVWRFRCPFVGLNSGLRVTKPARFSVKRSRRVRRFVCPASPTDSLRRWVKICGTQNSSARRISRILCENGRKKPQGAQISEFVRQIPPVFRKDGYHRAREGSSIREVRPQSGAGEAVCESSAKHTQRSTGR